VTSDVYSIPEVVGDAAILHAPHDIHAHVDSIRSLLSNREQCLEFASRAHDRADEFTWESAAAETAMVYSTVLES